MLPRLYPFDNGTMSPCASVVPVVVNVPKTVKSPPIVRLPEIFAVPVTVSDASGVVLLIPTLLLTASTKSVPLSMLTFVVAEIVATLCEAFDVMVKLLSVEFAVTERTPNVPTFVIPV